MLLKVPLTGLYAALCARDRARARAARDRAPVVDEDRSSATAATADSRGPIRVHGNAIEYVPLALILMLIVELGGASRMLLHACGIALVAARIVHAYGLTRTAGASTGRVLGTTVTFATTVVLVATALSLYLG